MSNPVIEEQLVEGLDSSSDINQKSYDSQDEFIKALQARNNQLIAEINFIKGSRGYRFLERIKSSRLAGLLLRIVQVLMPGFVPPPPPDKAQDVVADIVTRGIHRSNDDHQAIAGLVTQKRKRTVEDEDWVVKQQLNPMPVSINHPDWRGILASATELFGNVYIIPDNLDEYQAHYYAELIHDAGTPSITIQGFPLTYYHLIKAVRKVSPNLPVYVIWHGNFLHMPEDNDWEGLKLVTALYKEGDICKVGFVKQGMAEVMAKTIGRTQFIMNFVRYIPPGPSLTFSDKVHIGIWAQPDWNWKKLPYPMLASLALVDNCKGHLYNVSPRAREVGEFLKLNAEYHVADFITRSETFSIMAKMHINLYITLTECAPMMPLESLSQGSPCLFGPTSHYFLDHEYLHNCLVVPYPDNPEVIAKYSSRAIEERGTIIEQYRAYAPEYNRRALDSLEEFLEHPVNRS